MATGLRRRPEELMPWRVIPNMFLPLVTLILGLYVGDVELHNAHPPGIPPPNFNQQQAHQHPPQPPSQQAGQGQNLQFQQQQQQQQQQGQFQDPNVQHMQQQQQGHQHGGFRQQHEVHNAEHIKEHLKEVIDKPKEEMTEQELEFHYFKLHDYDENNKLDGIEITKAITHFHQALLVKYQKSLYHDTFSIIRCPSDVVCGLLFVNNSHFAALPEWDKKTGSKFIGAVLKKMDNFSFHEDDHEKSDPKVFTDQELVNIVDLVLKEDDLNGDGYVEYAEFVAAQRNAKDKKDTD